MAKTHQEICNADRQAETHIRLKLKISGSESRNIRCTNHEKKAEKRFRIVKTVDDHSFKELKSPIFPLFQTASMELLTTPFPGEYYRYAHSSQLSGR